MRRITGYLLGSAALALMAACSGGEEATSHILAEEVVQPLSSEIVSIKRWQGQTQDGKDCRLTIEVEERRQGSDLKATISHVGVSLLDSYALSFDYDLENEKYNLGSCGEASGIARSTTRSDGQDYSIVSISCKSEKADKKYSGSAGITFNDGTPEVARAQMNVEEKAKFGRGWVPAASYDIYCRNLVQMENVLTPLD